MALRIKNPKAGDWDYYGMCTPGERGHTWNKSFSIGIFQWIPKASGKGIKKGKAVKRVHGLVTEKKSVFKKAEAYILDNLEI